MALINCPQCGKQVSDKALKCPHCGLDMSVPYEPQKPQPQKVEENTKKPRKVLPIFLTGMGCMALVVFLLWLFVFKDNNVEEQKHVVPETISKVDKPQSKKESKRESTSNPTEEIKQLLFRWAGYHNDKNLTGLASLYADQVKYFHSNYSNSQVYNSKKKALDKNPQFRMEISNIRVVDQSYYYEVDFDKKVWFSPERNPKMYPSYLHVKKINGKWKIVTEGDLVTDKNMGK